MFCNPYFYRVSFVHELKILSVCINWSIVHSVPVSAGARMASDELCQLHRPLGSQEPHTQPGPVSPTAAQAQADPSPWPVFHFWNGRRTGPPSRGHRGIKQRANIRRLTQRGFRKGGWLLTLSLIEPLNPYLKVTAKAD